MNNTITIKELKDNFPANTNKTFIVNGYISKLDLLTKRDNITKYLKCVIGDSTGELESKHWDETKSLDIIEQFKEKNRKTASIIAEVKVGKWNDNIDLVIESFKIDFDKTLTDLIEKAKVSPNELFDKFKALIEPVEKPYYKQLLNILFDVNYQHPTEELKNKSKNIRNDFLLSSAATGHHHNYMHGLLEHSSGVIEEAVMKAERYKAIYPDIDMCLIRTGGAIHDIGKIYEYNYKEGIEYSDEGPFMYHPVSGTLLIHDIIREYNIDMPRKEFLKLVHILTSHHGEYSEHGPNQECPEAHLIALADNADSQANKVMRQMANGDLRKMRSRFV